jgi:TolA-binding protein
VEALAEAPLDLSAPEEEIAVVAEEGYADLSLPEDGTEAPSFEAAEEPAGEEDFVIDEFALPGTETLEEEEAAAATGPPEAAFEEEAPDFGPIPETPPLVEEGPEAEYTEREFAAIQRALAGLPLNLRIAIEQQIGSGGLSGEPLRRLLDGLIRGQSAAVIASALESATGISISVPKRFEKSTGLAFQRHRRSLGFFFSHTVGPLLRVGVVIAAVVVLLILGVNRFILDPIAAIRFYRRGLEHIIAEEYDEAAEDFQQGKDTHPIRRWYMTHAEAYREKTQWKPAERTYKDYFTDFGREKPAVLAYANMLTYDVRDYVEADSLLTEFRELEEANHFDYETLLALGDNYIEWAEEESDPQKVDARYDGAGDAYTRAIRVQGDKDEPWFRLLRYHIRKGNDGEVNAIKSRFDAARRVDVDPRVYSELAGFLIDQGELAEVREVLEASLRADADLPEIYFQFARYFERVLDPDNEARALDLAIEKAQNKESSGSLTRREKRQLILTHARKGDILAENQEHVKADEEYAEAIRRMELSVNAQELKITPDFGAIYARRADIHYYTSGRLDFALDLYQKAQENSYSGTNLNYKIGNIHYQSQRYQDALLAFHTVNQELKNNTGALLALANTLYERSDFHAAQGFYSHLAKRLEAETARIPILRPDENPGHRDLLDVTMRVHNNLGVTVQKISESTRDPEKESQALVHLTRSLEYFDRVSRNPVDLVRGEARNLAYLNSRGIIYPQSDFVLQIYREIPKDLESIRVQ